MNHHVFFRRPWPGPIRAFSVSSYHTVFVFGFENGVPKQIERHNDFSVVNYREIFGCVAHKCWFCEACFHTLKE